MNHYTIISKEEWELLQRHRQQLEVERIQRVLAYWQQNVKQEQVKQLMAA